jgi:hypothetical protein
MTRVIKRVKDVFPLVIHPFACYDIHGSSLVAPEIENVIARPRPSELHSQSKLAALTAAFPLLTPAKCPLAAPTILVRT